MKVPSVLTIAGSDSSGGAGIEADLKTFARLKVHGLCAITAVTSQNTKSIDDIFYLPEQVVVSQIKSVVKDINIDAVKTGMLGKEEVVAKVCELIQSLKIPNLVVDPVMKSKDRTSLLDQSGITLLKERLIPLATAITPNFEEAEVLSGKRINSKDDMKEAAKILRDLGTKWIVITGGHLQDKAIDILYDGRQYWEYEKDKVSSLGIHGTGCTFSAALAAYLAKGFEMPEAVLKAKEFVSKTIENALQVGQGYPIANQFYGL